MGYSFWKTFWLDQLKSSYPLTQWPNFFQVVLKKISKYEKKKMHVPKLHITMKMRNKFHISHY